MNIHQRRILFGVAAISFVLGTSALVFPAYSIEPKTIEKSPTKPSDSSDQSDTSGTSDSSGETRTEKGPISVDSGDSCRIDNYTGRYISTTGTCPNNLNCVLQERRKGSMLTYKNSPANPTIRDNDMEYRPDCTKTSQ